MFLILRPPKRPTKTTRLRHILCKTNSELCADKVLKLVLNCHASDILIVANSAIFVKIEGPVWYTIYHHVPVVGWVKKPP